MLLRIDNALDETLSLIMADGPADTLTLTQNAQPALFASSLGVLRALEAHTGTSASQIADYVAGHSLGEYSAICAAGGLELDETARLLRLRGQSMQQAVPLGEGAMAALLGADIEQTDGFLEQAQQTGLVQIANDNAPGQIVISGAAPAVHKAMEIAKMRLAQDCQIACQRAIPLRFDGTCRRYHGTGNGPGHNDRYGNSCGLQCERKPRNISRQTTPESGITGNRQSALA